jgi:hypothetical protein
LFSDSLIAFPESKPAIEYVEKVNTVAHIEAGAGDAEYGGFLFCTWREVLLHLALPVCSSFDGAKLVKN